MEINIEYRLIVPTTDDINLQVLIQIDITEYRLIHKQISVDEYEFVQTSIAKFYAYVFVRVDMGAFVRI